MSKSPPLSPQTILVEDKIFMIRGKQVMLDHDLAELYGVETKRITEAVKRNIERFPEEFRFQLTEEEYKTLRSQIVTSKNEAEPLRSQIATLKNGERGKHSKYLPYVFTEQGVAMLSAVLHSPIAIQVSIKIMDAFVKLRHIVQNQITSKDFESELLEIRKLLLLHIDHCDIRFNEQNKRINQVIKVLNNLIETPDKKEKIGFKGESLCPNL